MLAKRIVTISLLLILGNPICCCLADTTEDVQERTSCCSESHPDAGQPDDDCDCDQDRNTIAVTKLADQLTSITAPDAVPVPALVVAKPGSRPTLSPVRSSPPPSPALNLLFEVFLI